LLDFEIFGTAIAIQFRKLSSNCWYKSSPTNLSSLIKAEEEYIETKGVALEKWSENICANINNARNIKDKWF
jgi:hypothetical protein